MDIREAPTLGLQQELRKFKRHLRRYTPGSPYYCDIQSKLIAPIAAELARRSSEKVAA